MHSSKIRVFLKFQTNEYYLQKKSQHQEQLFEVIR